MRTNNTSVCEAARTEAQLMEPALLPCSFISVHQMTWQRHKNAGLSLGGKRSIETRSTQIQGTCSVNVSSWWSTFRKRTLLTVASIRPVDREAGGWCGDDADFVLALRDAPGPPSCSSFQPWILLAGLPKLSRGEDLPPHPSWVLVTGLMITELTQDKWTGKKNQIFNCVHRVPVEMGPKKRPRQAAFYVFRQRNNTSVRLWKNKET